VMSVSSIGDARSPLSFARRYARIGWHVLPIWWAQEVDGAWRCACGNAGCKNPAKHPISAAAPRGQDSATTDLAQIERWWTQYPEANIAAVLAPSNMVAIDIDPRNGGLDTIAEIEAQHGALESDVLQFTGGGGEHRLFSVPAAQALQLPGKLGPGVDVKHNGYIVLEPSSHVSGRRYAFEASSDPLDGAVASPLPDWIRDLARRPATPVDTGAAPARPPVSERELEDLRSALAHVPGDSRDTWLAVGMAIHNDIGGQLGYDIWSTWSRESCPAKFDPVDQMRVWRSFRRRPMGEAVQLPTVFKMAYERGLRPAPPVAAAEVAKIIPVAPSRREPGDVPSHLLTVPGALRLAVEWGRATSKKPQPLFDVQAALATGSTVLGRRYRTDNDNWSALYFLNVAKSGAGKEHAKHTVETLLEAAGYGHLVGSGRFASESSIISALVGQPCHVAILDEFGKAIEESNAAGNWMARGTLKGLIEVWGRAHSVLRPVAYSTAGLSSRQAEELAKRMVRKPSLTLLAMSTPESMFDAMTNKSAVDGFLNRFVIVFSDVGRQPPTPTPFVDVPLELTSWMHDVRNRGAEGNLSGIDVPHDREPAPITMAIDDAAHRLFAAFGRDCDALADELESEGLAEMTARHCEIAMRLSLVVAASMPVPTITADAAQWSIDYVRSHGARTMQQLRANMSDGPFHRLYKAVLRLVAEAPAPTGITTREIGRRCRPWNQATKKTQDDCLSALMRDGYIVARDRESASGRGRAGAAYFMNTVDGVDIVSTGGVDG